MNRGGQSENWPPHVHLPRNEVLAIPYINPFAASAM